MRIVLSNQPLNLKQTSYSWIFLFLLGSDGLVARIGQNTVSIATIGASTDDSCDVSEELDLPSSESSQSSANE